MEIIGNMNLKIVKSIVAPLEKEISQLEQRCINLTLQVAFMESNLSTAACIKRSHSQHFI
jgi:hypothetical protein